MPSCWHASASFAIFLLFSSLLGCTWAADGDLIRLGNKTIERTVQLRTHSLFAPYIDQDLQNRWWDFGADAYVNTNKHVRLTRARPSQMGWLWSRLPLTSSNFVVEVEFKIGGESTNLFGDGMAIWLTKERTQPGPVFGSKDNFEGIGIFLDTYANARHTYAFPRITGMLGDGKTSYKYNEDGEGQAVGGCSANFRRTSVATKLKITYVKDSFLDVKVQYKAWDDWSDCFYLEGVSLPVAPFLGFSAMTGDVSDNHDVISVSTYSAIISATSNDAAARAGGYGGYSRSGGSWTAFFFKALLLAAICAGGWYGWQEYKRRQMYGGGFSAGGRGGFGGMGGYGGGGSGGWSSGMGGGMGMGDMRSTYSSSKRF